MGNLVQKLISNPELVTLNLVYMHMYRTDEQLHLSTFQRILL